MKGITKDYLSLQYERSMLKRFRITSQAINSDFPVLAGSLLHL